MVYQRIADIDFALNALPALPAPDKVLLTSPAHFDVKYVINPHMAGHIGNIDAPEAQRQWDALHKAYTSVGIASYEIEGQEGYPDMVFCANQTLPYFNPHKEEKGVLLSNMHAPQRKGEVRFYADFFQHMGYDVDEVASTVQTDFEGMGDAIWHPNRYLLWGGYGFRTEVAVYRTVSDRLAVRVLALHLSDPDFYHLDTCFSVLNEKAVMIYPGAFSEDGLALIDHFFEQVIECPEDESRQLFACNAHCPDEKHVIIQQGCTHTMRMLRAAGFIPIEVDTSEYLKSGGSVFCMKQMFW